MNYNEVLQAHAQEHKWNVETQLRFLLQFMNETRVPTVRKFGLFLWRCSSPQNLAMEPVIPTATMPTALVSVLWDKGYVSKEAYKPYVVGELAEKLPKASEDRQTILQFDQYLTEHGLSAGDVALIKHD